MKILQINSVVNSGSTGRIAEDIGNTAIKAGYESYIAAGYTNRPSQSEVISIGNSWDRNLHGLKTRLLDRHGFGSKTVTQQFVKQIRAINPDIILLHNIHGYYLNIDTLFNYLKEVQKPIVWTFHDCWPFTGHCSYFDGAGCYKWQTECKVCPNIMGYPASWGIDNSTKNFYRKKALFTGLKKLTIVTPSQWLADHVKNSFLNEYPTLLINNGIDIEKFRVITKSSVLAKYSLREENIILGVAGTWDKRKGLDDFIKLRNQLSPDIQIVLVGLSSNQIKSLPNSVLGITHTESIDELAALYSAADVFVNPTYVDNFPTTNIEAIACGTPVIMYKTGGSPEAIDDHTGMVVGKGDIIGLKMAIELVFNNGKDHYRDTCRARAERLYNKDDRFQDYIELFQKLIG